MNLLDALPAIGTFLAGPAGGLAASGVQWLAEKFGASEATVDGIKQTLAGMKPEQLLEAKKLDIEFQKFCMENGIKLQLAQIAVNVEEAKSSDPFTSRARPAAIWVGVIGLAYAGIVEPILRFTAVVIFGYTGAFPVIDSNLTLQVLGGLLGLSALRSMDKKNGVAS
jgi:hypothetical protein